MGFEIPLDSDYFHHPKTKFLIGLAGKRADVFPPRLWAWCSKYAQDGYVKGGCAQIEAVVDWDGDPGVLHRAMIKAGFLEKDGKTVHDWMEHSGRQIALYQQKKRKQRETYASKFSSGRIPEDVGKKEEECKNSSDDSGKTSAYPEDPNILIPPTPKGGNGKIPRKRKYGTPEEEAAELQRKYGAQSEESK